MPLDTHVALKHKHYATHTETFLAKEKASTQRSSNSLNLEPFRATAMGTRKQTNPSQDNFSTLGSSACDRKHYWVWKAPKKKKKIIIIIIITAFQLIHLFVGKAQSLISAYAEFNARSGNFIKVWLSWVVIFSELSGCDLLVGFHDLIGVEASAGVVPGPTKLCSRGEAAQTHPIFLLTTHSLVDICLGGEWTTQVWLPHTTDLLRTFLYSLCLT